MSKIGIGLGLIGLALVIGTIVILAQTAQPIILAGKVIDIRNFTYSSAFGSSVAQSVTVHTVRGDFVTELSCQYYQVGDIVQVRYYQDNHRLELISPQGC